MSQCHYLYRQKTSDNNTTKTKDAIFQDRFIATKRVLASFSDIPVPDTRQKWTFFGYPYPFNGTSRVLKITDTHTLFMKGISDTHTRRVFARVHKPGCELGVSHT